MKIIIFGPQGSGKGTQAELIARRHDLPYISTGDIFRYNLKNQTALGQKVAEYINNGLLVPDDLTNEIVHNRIQQPDCTVGYVLDGYPRNSGQMDFIKKIAAIDLAIVIDLSDDEATRRLSGRLACKCGLSYHKDFNPSLKTNRCDKCDSELFIREDDKPQAIKKRLATYHQETKPLFAAFKKEKKLFQVDGSKSIEEVYQQIEEIIKSH
ncbi:MAG: adenylate kinase [Candidatus Magasanikbacteria bacterium]|nr:adenylate kinase [Candidatus Magasanikbacteria bacterium]